MTAFEELAEGITVCRSEQHGFGTDAFLLAYFSRWHAKDTVCDLGTGCGIIPMLMQREHSPKHIYAVDIQPEAIEQLKAGLAHSSREMSIEPICADLRTLWEGAPVHTLDLVTCNPPYFAGDAGYQAAENARRLARHEVACGIGDVCKAAAHLLKCRGRLCVCSKPERLADVFCAMRENGIEPKRLRFVCKSPESAPWLFLAEGMKEAKPFLRVEPPLIVRSGEGLTDEAAKITHFGENYI